jgi:hypothetical protein
MEKKKPSISHQALYHSLCDTTAQQQQQQQHKNGSTQTPKTKTIIATTKFPEVPRRPEASNLLTLREDSEIMTFFSFFGGLNVDIYL